MLNLRKLFLFFSLSEFLCFEFDINFSPSFTNFFDYQISRSNYRSKDLMKNTVRIEGWDMFSRRDSKSKQKRIWSAWSSHLATRTRMAEPSNKRNNRIIDFGQMIGRSTIIIHYYPYCLMHFTHRTFSLCFPFVSAFDHVHFAQRFQFQSFCNQNFVSLMYFGFEL